MEKTSRNRDTRDQGRKPVVAFICTHNSCRSQIAEALGRKLAADTFVSVSAGTAIKDAINPDAVRLMKDRYGIDMEQNGQHPKLLSELPEVDIVITMGCGVQCPYLPAKHREDWGLEDPTGQSDVQFLKTIETIEKKVMELRERIQKGEI
jgi:arsenate reductase